VFRKLGRSLSGSLLVALVGPLTLAACGAADSNGASIIYSPCQPLSVMTEPDITAAELAGVSVGIALWNSRAGARLMLVLAGNDAGSSSASMVPVRFQQAAAPFHGYYDSHAGLIFINRQLGTEHERAVTVAHELGHAFGLVHVASGSHPSVMITGNLVVEPTLSDVDDLATLWGRCGQ
jgi:hypothetical protein